MHARLIPVFCLYYYRRKDLQEALSEAQKQVLYHWGILRPYVTCGLFGTIKPKARNDNINPITFKFYTTTLEPSNQTQEQAEFSPSYDQAQIISSPLYNHTSGGNYSTRPTGATGEIIGLSRSLAVVSRDTITMEVFGKYLSPTSTNSSVITGIASAITTAFGLSSFSGGELQEAYNALNAIFGT